MADKTALAESSQALFCSIADYLGTDGVSKSLDLETYPTYIEFKSKNVKLIEDSFKRTLTPGVTLKDMETFLIANRDWYKSSVLIASKLIKDRGIPTWYIPSGNGKGTFHTGVRPATTNLLQKNLLQKNIKRRFRFGEDVIPQIGTLAKYGRNFPDGNSFQIPNSWNTDVTNMWSNPLLSGTLGREFGPGNTDKIYTNNY